MARPFSKTLRGKFFLRTALLTFVVTMVVAVLAIIRLRSLTSTANSAVDSARGNLSEEAVGALEVLANDISSASSTTTVILAAVVILGTIAAGVVALSFAGKITAPIVRLRSAAMMSAAALPEFIEASTRGDEEVPALPLIDLNSGDEVEDLARSFNQVQQAAAQLTVQQVRMQKRNADRFVNLGRRSQNLLTRQMSLIDGMEKDEANPANLQRLFQVDHLATRMRRTSESMLVLADESSPRQLNRPVSMHQVVQAASGEIEHFNRVTIADVSGVAVAGSVATDLAHLLAELLENATSFSSPEAATLVRGGATEQGYLLEIVDHGFGMEPEQMATANQRFADPAGVVDDHERPAYLGHDVVSRLSMRHGVGVELVPTPVGGVTARVHVPQSALAAVETLVKQRKPKPVHTEPVVLAESPAPTVIPEAPVAQAPAASVAEPDSHAQVASFEAPVAQPPVTNGFAASLPDVSPAAEMDLADLTPELSADVMDAQPVSAESLTADSFTAESLAVDSLTAESLTAESLTVESLTTGAAPSDAPHSGLTAEQMAAIQWANENKNALAAVRGGGSESDENAFAAVGASAELRPGPVDADTLAEMMRETADEL